jgi:hypothetical protein
MPAEMTDRRFPPPWSIEELDECFIVRDADGQALGYFYFDEEQQSPAIDRRLTRDDARRMAVNFAKLPDLVSVRGRGCVPGWAALKRRTIAAVLWSLLGEQTMTALQLVTGNRDWAEVVPTLPAVHERRLLILSEPADRSLYPPSPEDAWLAWTPLQHHGLS